MTEAPIPDDLRDAFQEAIGASFGNWLMGGPAPEIFLNGRAYFIEAICARVLRFPDAMPDYAYDELCGVLRNFATGDLPEDRTYASGARCLLALCNRLRARGAT
jgi:hypothetical protein